MELVALIPTDANPNGIKAMKHAQDIFQAPQDIKETRFKPPPLINL